MTTTEDHAPLMGRPPRDDHFLFGDPSTPTHAPDVLHGLRPRHLNTATEPSGSLSEWSQRTVRGGLPLLMTGSLAAGVGVTQAMPVVDQPDTQPLPGDSAVHTMKTSLSEFIHQAFVPLSQRVVNSVAPHVPDTYTVRQGDTITSVAEKFGLPTTVVLTLNGLSWNSILHEGQVVRLTMAPGKQRGVAPTRVSAQGYVVQTGDTLASIAERLGISERALADANGLQPGTPLSVGRALALPGTAEQLAPRTIPAATTQAPRIVFASATSSPDTTDVETAENQDNSPSDEPQVITDPLEAEILDAPELRPEKKAAPPPPPPPPPPAPEPKPEPKPEPQAQKQDNAGASEKPEQEAEPTSSTVGQPISGAITPLNDTRRKNASVIVQVGRDLGVPDYGIVIALATAMQESSLRNIDWGDRDSVGLFQQRPSSGWGSVEQIMDPAYAARAFYGGPNSPTPGRTRGLLNISGWQSMELTVAAQRVQISAHPDAYAKWEASAWAWLEELS